MEKQKPHTLAHRFKDGLCLPDPENLPSTYSPVQELKEASSDLAVVLGHEDRPPFWPATRPSKSQSDEKDPRATYYRNNYDSVI